MATTVLEKTAYRIVQALKRQDWGAFRQECAPIIAFHEYRCAYPQDYPKGLYEKAFGGFLSGKELEDHRMTFAGWAVQAKKPLTRAERDLFHSFCEMVKHNYLPGQQGESSVVDEIEISEDLADEDEAPFLYGPAIRGRIASNAEWRIEMELHRGQWKVRRLIVASH